MEEEEGDVSAELVVATKRTVEAVIADVRERVGATAVELLRRGDELPFPTGGCWWAEYGTDVDLRWRNDEGRFHELHVIQMNVGLAEITWRWRDRLEPSGPLVEGQSAYDSATFAARLRDFLRAPR